MIGQLDGNESVNSGCSDDSDDDTECDTDNEAYSHPVRAMLVPVQQPGPLLLEVDTTGQARQPTCIPLCISTNARSLRSKMNNLRHLLRQIGPDYCAVSETWESPKFKLKETLQMEHYQSISYCRPSGGLSHKGKRRGSGGGAAIIYTENNFHVENANVPLIEGVEAAWAIFTPKHQEIENIKRICVGSIYVSPRSSFKSETIDHIIETIYLIKTRYNNEVNFQISGDFNRLDISDILNANGALKQI